MVSEAATLNDNDHRQRKATFRKREKTLRKNTGELAALCGIPALTICFAPDRTVSTWPESKEEVRAIIARYRGVGLHESSRYSLTLADHLEENRMKYGRTTRQRLVGMSRADAVEATRSIDSMLRVVGERIEFLALSRHNHFENRRVAEPTCDGIRRETTGATLPGCKGDNTKIIRLFGKDVMVNSS